MTTKQEATKKQPKTKREKIQAKTVFTTGEVALLCAVAPRTVSKWFDSGLLKGHRVPGSADRRITRAVLIDFMRSSGMDYSILIPASKIVVYTDPVTSTVPAMLRQCMRAVPGCPFEPDLVASISSNFELGSALIDNATFAVLYDLHHVSLERVINSVTELRAYYAALPVHVYLPSGIAFPKALEKLLLPTADLQDYIRGLALTYSQRTTGLS